MGDVTLRRQPSTTWFTKAKIQAGYRVFVIFPPNNLRTVVCCRHQVNASELLSYLWAHFVNPSGSAQIVPAPPTSNSDSHNEFSAIIAQHTRLLIEDNEDNEQAKTGESSQYCSYSILRLTCGLPAMLALQLWHLKRNLTCMIYCGAGYSS